MFLDSSLADTRERYNLDRRMQPLVDFLVPFFFVVSAALAYLRRKRSTRPAVSISFCLPVKNGWQAEQIST